MSDQNYVYYWHKLYDVWYNMLDRCYNEECRAYRYYGERGITICDKWRYDFISFYLDGFEPYTLYVEENGKHPTIDRINNNKGYTPKNCRWTDYEEQYWNSRNKGTQEDINRSPKIIRYPFNNYSLEDRHKFAERVLPNTTKRLR